MPSTIYISVGHTAHSKYNTGIQRVTRSIAREALKLNPKTELLEWNIERGRYITLDDNARRKLAHFNGPEFCKIETEFTRILGLNSIRDGRFDSMPEVSSSERIDKLCEYLNSNAAVLLYEASLRYGRERQSPWKLAWVVYIPVTQAMRRKLRYWIRSSRDFVYRQQDRYRIRGYDRGLKVLRRALWRNARGVIALVAEWKRASKKFEYTIQKEAFAVRESIGQARLRCEKHFSKSAFESKGFCNNQAASMALACYQSANGNETPKGVGIELEDALELVQSDGSIREFESIVASFKRFVHLPLDWVKWMPISQEWRRRLRRGIRDYCDFVVRMSDRRLIGKHIAKVLAARKSVDDAQVAVERATGALHNEISSLMKHLASGSSCLSFQLGSAVGSGSFSKKELKSRDEGQFSIDFIEQFEPALNRLSPLNFEGREGVWIVIPELMKQDEMKGAIDWAKEHGGKVAIVFHDSIPLLYPDWVNDTIRANHEGYQEEMLRADCILAVSEFSAKCFLEFARERNVECPRVEVCPNGVSFATEEAGEVASNERGESLTLSVLHVGTLEPRKNHRILLEAWRMFRIRNPDSNAKLTLVGNRYDGFEDIANWVADFVGEEGSVEWLGGIDDATVMRLYQKCAFTVFPSIVEGFGLPILESVWHGKPCLTANFGAMEEVARKGGCLTVDTNDAHSLAEGIEAMVTDDALRSRLAAECRDVPLRSWKDYAVDMHRLLGVEWNGSNT